MKAQNRISTLDAFRGIAAVLVILFHYTTRYDQIFISSSDVSFWFGWIGVPIFFILSGFVIHLTIDRSKNALEFLKKRFYRLYPTYWLCIIITLFFIYAFNLQHKTEFAISYLDILINFTMWHDFFGFKHIDGAYWSLLPELLFYILMATLVLTKLLKKFYLINSILIVLGVIHFFFNTPIFNKVFDLDYILLFFIGICFYRLKNNKAKKVEHLFIIVNLIIGSFLFQEAQTSNDIKFVLLSFTIIVFLYYCFIWGKLNWLGKIRILIFFGNISYALYLVHQVMGYAIINYFEVNFNAKMPGILSAFIFSVFMAYIITYKIEPIFRRKIIKFTTKQVISQPEISLKQ